MSSDTLRPGVRAGRGEVIAQRMRDGRSRVGVTGALALADRCVDALTGFEPGADCDPLTPVRCEYFGEATRTEPAYIITFTTMADQIPPEFFSTC